MLRRESLLYSAGFLALTISFCSTKYLTDALDKSVSRGVLQGIASASFKAHKFSYLNITERGTAYNALDGDDCGFACVDEPSCFSYNLAAFSDANGRILCELLQSDKYNNSDKFVSSQFFHHFSIVSLCKSHPCQNGGTCVSVYEKNSYVCLCKKGYTGSICQTDIDDCASHPCKNNGICTDQVNGFNCSCPSGFNGTQCETDIVDCASHPCQNNGICTDKLNGFNCSCAPGFNGTQCETDICVPCPCTNNGTCNFSNAPGFHGTQNQTVHIAFTTIGRSGRFGAVQNFTVPRSTRYVIKAWGAMGGTHMYDYGYNPGTYSGGRGAYIEGKFNLTKGTVLNIVVGQRGGNSVEVYGGQLTNKTAAQLRLSVEDNAGTGGGGGSFVYTTSNVLLLAAGGGGGASSGYNGVDGQEGTSGTSSVGKDSSEVRNGGTGGQPGECNTADASYHGGVGAGWYAQGCVRAGTEHGERGGSRAQGWTGGRAGGMNSGYNGGPVPGAVGRFGGGGGGSEDNGASGGGGGYSGGGSGTHENQAGGGGGSFCSGQGCSGVTGGNCNNVGLVEIDELAA